MTEPEPEPETRAPATPSPSPMRHGLVVALDGPGSSGKSSVGSAAAARLGYRFCDTGLLYRAITWLAGERGTGPDDPGSLVALVDAVRLVDDGAGRLARVEVDGRDVTELVQAPDVDAAVSAVARVPELRSRLNVLQRELAAGGSIVMTGRDIGTVVLPDADVKLYLDASPEERAARRAAQRGIDPTSPEGLEILEDLRRRDGVDSGRAVAPLRPADDGIIVRTDGNAFETTVETVVAAVRAVEATPATTSSVASPGAPGTVASQEPASQEPASRATKPRRTPIPPVPVATELTPLIRFVCFVFRIVVRIFARVRIEGDLAGIPRSGAFIMAANHASSADPVLIGAFLNPPFGRPMNWLGKREVFDNPILAWMARRGGVHPVDRDAADVDAFRSAMRILESGNILAIFPEGTRSRDGALHEAKQGVGVLALKAGSPILPVAVIDTDRMWPRGSFMPRFGSRVTVRIGRPFTVEPATPGPGRDRRAASGAATRRIMAEIARLLPERQRGIYAADVGDLPAV